MGFQEVTTLDAEVVISLGGINKKTGKKNPGTVEGYYLGSRKVESKRAKNGFSYIHFLQTAKGNVGVWGKTDLDRKLTLVTPGTMIRASHSGMQTTPNGEMYKYKVELDKDNTIEVSAQPVEGIQASDSGADYNGEETEGYDSTEDTSGSEDEDYDSAPASFSVQQLANKARVEALLKGKKA